MFVKQKCNFYSKNSGDFCRFLCEFPMILADYCYLDPDPHYWYGSGSGKSKWNGSDRILTPAKNVFSCCIWTMADDLNLVQCSTIYFWLQFTFTLKANFIPFEANALYRVILIRLLYVKFTSNADNISYIYI